MRAYMLVFVVRMVTFADERQKRAGCFPARVDQTSSSAEVEVSEMMYNIFSSCRGCPSI